MNKFDKNGLISNNIFTNSIEIGGGAIDITDTSISWKDNFVFSAKDDDTLKKLTIKTSDDRITIGYDYVENIGPVLAFRSINFPDYAGEFILIAKNSTTESSLRGRPTGELLWKGKSIISIIEENHNGRNWYIKLSNGFMLQGGDATFINQYGTVTFNKPFGNASCYSLQVTATKCGSSSNYNPAITSRTATNFNYNTMIGVGEAGSITWFACGLY